MQVSEAFWKINVNCNIAYKMPMQRHFLFEALLSSLITANSSFLSRAAI